MFRARLRLVLLLGVLPSIASGQSWTDAYKAGEYQKAADLLHPLVIELIVKPDYGDPNPARSLATMYAEGLGVPQDLIAACSLGQVVAMATQFAAPKYAERIGAFEAAVKDADQFVNKHCAGLTDWDRMTANVSIGCFAFGMPEQTLMLGSDAVSVGRGGIWLREARPERPQQLMNCLERVARVRAVTIEPPADAAPGVVARHFVELVGWAGGQRPDGSARRYALQWQLYELRKKTIAFVHTEFLDEVDHWPEPALTENFDQRVSMEMIRSGHVRWRADGAPPKRGWIMLPEESAR
jgi:hypothetical protein